MEDDPKFAKFKAGSISDELRQALGLRASQLPPYIYRMRMLGYPPGHLQDAIKETSGLAVFDADGKGLQVDDGFYLIGISSQQFIQFAEVPKNSDKSKEEGEVEDEGGSGEGDCLQCITSWAVLT